MPTTTIEERIVDGWLVIFYDPDDVELPKEDRKIILDKKYISMTDVYAEINPIALSRGIEVSKKTMETYYYQRDGKYKNCKKPLFLSLEFSKIKLKIEVTKVIKWTTNTKTTKRIID